MYIEFFIYLLLFVLGDFFVNVNFIGYIILVDCYGLMVVIFDDFLVEDEKFLVNWLF